MSGERSGLRDGEPNGAVVFDLDGTLIDSQADIAHAMNRALAKHGLPAHPVEAYRLFVGEGVEHLVQRALPPEQQGLKASVMAEYRKDYAQNATVHTRPFPGIEALLESLGALGLKLAVLSNKPDAPTRMLVEQLLRRFRFEVVFGERPGVPKKPDPTAAREIANVLRVPAEACLFVGDTPIDMRTAVAAGMSPIGVLWGFRGEDELRAAGARHLLAHPKELLAVLEHRTG
jgi:phosphoglycolate phosphatase